MGGDDMAIAIISVIAACAGVFVAALALIRSNIKDTKQNAAEGGKTSVILKDIKDDIRDLRDAQNRQDGKQEAYLERLVAVEQSTKQAHHRIDEIRDKLNMGDK